MRRTPACRASSRIHFRLAARSILTHTLNALLLCKAKAVNQILHNIVVRPCVISQHDTIIVFLQITDVTVVVTRERVLRERQNARYHAIVDLAPDAIITIDNDRVIQWVNGAVDHVLGYGHPELLGQKLDILLQPDNPLVSALAESSVDQKADAAISVVGRHKNGKSGHFEISLGSLASRSARFRHDNLARRHGARCSRCGLCAMHAMPCKELTMNWKAGSRNGHASERSR